MAVRNTLRFGEIVRIDLHCDGELMLGKVLDLREIARKPAAVAIRHSEIGLPDLPPQCRIRRPYRSWQVPLSPSPPVRPRPGPCPHKARMPSAPDRANWTGSRRRPTRISD